MIKVLRDYIKDDKRIIEYSRDGKTVSHRVTTSAKEVDEDEIVIPKSPLKELEELEEKQVRQSMETAMMIAQLQAEINALKGGE